MSKISLIAKLTIADGKGDELDAALATLVTAAEEEPGLEIYSAHRDAADPNTVYFFEVYADDEAMAVHGKGDAMKAAMGALGGLLAGRPEITKLDPIVAKGLSL